MNEPYTLYDRGQCYDASTDNPDSTFSAAQFVRAWQHVRAIFAQKNVTNVLWVWTPAVGGADPEPYYPGDSQVDWIGTDAYDPAGAGFASVFASTYASLARHNKPILAVTGEPAASQAAFFPGIVPALSGQFPLVKGFIYYDGVSAAGDWRLASGGGAAYTAFANDPYMSAQVSF
jgi:hypothetical protein